MIFWKLNDNYAPHSLQSSHKKTFFYLEQLLLKHRAHTLATRIKETGDGIDFFFPTKQNARKLVDFLSSVAPCKWAISAPFILLYYLINFFVQV